MHYKNLIADQTRASHIEVEPMEQILITCEEMRRNGENIFSGDLDFGLRELLTNAVRKLL